MAQRHGFVAWFVAAAVSALGAVVAVPAGAGPISGNAFNLSNRLGGSSAPVGRTPAPWSVVGAQGGDQRTPASGAGLTEVVARGDWNSGNAVLVLVTGSGRRTAWAYDGNAADAPVLHLTDTVPWQPVR